MQNVKMVVTGPFSAGKTQLIKSISEIEVVSTERKLTHVQERAVKETTTIAMDFGRITVDQDLVLYLFGTPGQKRFDFMWEILSEGMLGFIVVVDSTRPETFREARSILETFRAYAPTPYVVAANKQDLKDAWDLQDMRHALRLDDGTKILPCIATEKTQVKAVLLELLYSILDKMGASRERDILFSGGLRVPSPNLALHPSIIRRLTGSLAHVNDACCAIESSGHN